MALFVKPVMVRPLQFHEGMQRFKARLIVRFLVFAVASSALSAFGETCEHLKGYRDDMDYIRCMDRIGWNGAFGSSSVQEEVPLAQSEPEVIRAPRREEDCEPKNPVKDFTDIMAWTGEKYAAPPKGTAAKVFAKGVEVDRLAQVRRPTAMQEECRAKAPKKPQRIVIAFDGRNFFGTFNSQMSSRANELPDGTWGGMRGSIISNGVLRVPDVQWQYHDESTVRDQRLTDSVRCAYEWATKEYRNSKGEKVYSTVTLIGYSFGSNAAYNAAEQLRKMGVSVELMITVDPRQPETAWHQPAFGKPNNVERLVNFHQSFGLRGFELAGAENHRVYSGFLLFPHLRVPFHDQVVNGVTRSLSQVPVCRSSLSVTAASSATANCI